MSICLYDIEDGVVLSPGSLSALRLWRTPGTARRTVLVRRYTLRDWGYIWPSERNVLVSSTLNFQRAFCISEL